WSFCIDPNGDLNEIGKATVPPSEAAARVFRAILISLAFIAFVPPIFFFFKLKRFHQTQLRKCGWLNEPPLVCAHGGDSSKAFPNTMAAYHFALHSQVDCIEIDVSRSLDGVLLALHDRDLQRLTGNNASKVGYLSMKEIKDLGSVHQSARKFPDENVPTIEEALELISSSVRRVILDIKVGPPSYEKGLASDVLSVVKRMQCMNCLVWAKSDNLARDVIKLSSDVTRLKQEFEIARHYPTLVTTSVDKCKHLWKNFEKMKLTGGIFFSLLGRYIFKDKPDVQHYRRPKTAWSSADTLVGYIVMIDPSTRARTNLLRMKGAGVVGVYHPLIDETLVRILHGRKKKVYAWTVDDMDSMQEMLYERVDAIVTSNPTTLQGLMQDIRTECLEHGFSLSE
ncbi:PLC-like phosphodiesterases superfamily protein, partial [Prunus dulcis]